MMSVDKFGRHERRVKTLQGPKGEGISLTSDGDYDMSRKRLKFVKEPIDSTDAANKQYVDSSIPLKSDSRKSYSFHQFSIKDVAYPQDAADCVNLNYVKTNCLSIENGVLDVKDSTISNAKGPKKKNDLATKQYVDFYIPTLKKNILGF